MDTNGNIKKDIILILVGAIISASTAYVTSAISENRQDKKATIQKKLELNDQLSKDLGKRLYLTYKLYNTKRDNLKDSLNLLSAYKESKEEWNIKIYSYQSLLKHYYSEDVKEEFINLIYEPLIKLGQEAEHSTYNSLFTKKWKQLQKSNIEFITKIYDLAEN